MTKEIWDAIIADGDKPVCEFSSFCGEDATVLVDDCPCCPSCAREMTYTHPEDEAYV